MAERSGHVITIAAVTAVVTAIAIVVLLAIVLANLWWSLQQSFGHEMFHKLSNIVTGAEFVQAFSLLVAMSMTVGAITVYLSRKVIKSDRTAARAGVLAGLNMAGAVFICLMAQFVLGSMDMAYMLKFAIENVPRMMLLWMIVPGIIVVPSSVAGAVLLWRSLASAAGNSQKKTDQGITCRAAGIPVVIVVLALSIAGIIALPLAGTWLACQTGLISAEPYDWEHPAVPENYMWAASNTSYTLIDLARNYSGHTSFDWGVTTKTGPAEEANLLVIAGVNDSMCKMGVIGRPLTPGEAAMGLNQTVTGNSTEIGQVVFVTRGPISANLTRFIDFTLSPEGQALLNKSTTVPY
jgi:hypothetical protein